MDFEEFKFLINRITILSDKCAGLKMKNKILEKRLGKLEFENQRLIANNEMLGKKLTELNHEMIKSEAKEMPDTDFHGKIRIKELKNDR